MSTTDDTASTSTPDVTAIDPAMLDEVEKALDGVATAQSIPQGETVDLQANSIPQGETTPPTQNSSIPQGENPTPQVHGKLTSASIPQGETVGGPTE